MKKNVVFCFVFLFACNHSQKRDPSIDLQKLASLLPVANWQIMNGDDTSYVYFSSQFDHSYKVYEYKLVHGDSVVTWEGRISISRDSVVWSWNHQLLFLVQASDTRASWKDRRGERYVLQKVNDSSLQLRSSSIYLNLKKTLPLSTFLVRARYDYDHGTKLLHSTEVPPRKVLRKK